MKRKLNIAFAWWWTGWHVTPIFSMVQYAKQNKDISDKIDKMYRFWSKWQLEEKFAKEEDAVQFVSIRSWKLRRYRTIKSTLENLRDVAYFNAWYMQSLYYLQQYKIDRVFCKWWYVALPVVFAAASLRIPITVHESDMHAWLVNKMASKVAKDNFTWFPWVFWQKGEEVGQILSGDLLASSEDMDLFTLQPDKKTLLIMCGSQGSESIFNWLLEELDKEWQIVKNVNIVVILWLLNTSFKKKFEPYLNVTCFDFLDAHQLATIYKQTDVSVTRWSATTLAEMEYFWIPKVIVPLKSHDQPQNAKWYQEKYEDIVVSQSNLQETSKAINFHLDNPRKAWTNKNFFKAHKKIWSTLLKL